MQEITIGQLKAMEALTDVPDNQLQWLIDNGTCRHINAGEVVFTFGDAFTSTFFMLSGKLRLCIKQGNQIVELSVMEAGSIGGYIPFSRAKVSIVQAECTEDMLILQVPGETIKGAVQQYFELTEALVHIMTNRIRFVTTQQQQQEKMFALGKLSAGLAHELNNPAAAIGRSASALSGQLAGMSSLLKQLTGTQIGNEKLEQFKKILMGVITRTDKPVLGMLERSAKEDDLTDWLEDNDINDFTLAETLVEYGFTTIDLNNLKNVIPGEAMLPMFSWISYHLTTAKIVKEIEDSAERISTLVGAVKSFSHMDRGGDKQYINIHTGLENTLTMLNYKLKKGHIEVVRNFNPSLPQLRAMPGELNQVWTNIIDNAIDAMEVNGKGILTIKTEQERSNILVTITDNGPGVPDEISNMIFDPFFTTKEIGKGSGIGLDVVLRIVKQHSGSVKVKSVPGETSFIICLPENQS